MLYMIQKTTHLRYVGNLYDLQLVIDSALEGIKFLKCFK